jgi:heptosyltransferase-3
MKTGTAQGPRPKRILLTQLRRIGDVLMTTPAVRAVRETYPDAHIVYLTEAPSDQIFRNSPLVNEVWAADRNSSLLGRWRLMQDVRRGRFDAVVDFFSNPGSAQLAWFSGAPLRVGFAFRGRQWAYTEAIPPSRGLTYAAEDKLTLLEPLGIGPRTGASLLPEIFLPEEPRAYAARTLAGMDVAPDDLLVALCPVSRQPYKVWPAANFARIADILIERYQAKILMIAGPGEEHFVDAVRAEMVHFALPALDAPNLLEMAALMERCHLFVGNDGGPRHFAIAVGTPTVAVFGRPFPEHWTPPGVAEHRTASYDPGCKHNCTYPRCGMECIRQVPYEPVQAHAEALLAEVLKDGRPARRGPAA